MRVVTVPNWSFGRSRALLQAFREILEAAPVRIHYLQSDADHNRTVSAFSGDHIEVAEALLQLTDTAFAAIDLNRHAGVHPRIGALDVCPFVPLDPDAPLPTLNHFVAATAERLAERQGVPVFLYERSERGRHEADLPSLRRGGFGGLIGKRLNPDFGPPEAHPRLGVTVMGVRDPLIAMNVNLETEDLYHAKALAKEIRAMREEGDPRFLGVRALGLPLASQGLTQVSCNLTLPDLATPDGVAEWIMETAALRAVKSAGTEMIGIVRMRDLPGATRFQIRPEQVVDSPSG